MAALFGPIGLVVNMNQAVNGNALGNPSYASQIQVAEGTGGQAAVIAQYNTLLAASNPATLATTIMNNLFITTAAGVPAASVTALNAAIAQLLATYPTAKGQVIANITSLLGNLEGDATWGPAAVAFNNQAAADYIYSNNTANANAGVPSAVTTYTLTTGIDTQTATAFTGVIDFAGGITAGANTTMNPGDTLTGTSGLVDALNVSLLNAGGAVGTATAAVAQVDAVTQAAGGTAGNLVTFAYNGVQSSYVVGANVTATALAFQNAINAIAGTNIAAAGAAGVTNVTAPVAGTPFSIGIISATAAADRPAIGITTANTPSSGGAISFGNTTGVEVLNITNNSGQLATINVGTTLASANTVNVNGGTSDSAFTNIQATVNKLGMSNIATDDVDATYTYATGLTGAADALTFNATGVQSATVPVAAGNFPLVTIRGAAAGSGWDIVNVVASGANRFESFIVNDQANSTMATLNVSGSGSFRVGTSLDFLGTTGTFNASTATGAQNVMFGAEVITATGGSGNDRFAFDAVGVLTVADSINGGTGTDTLAITDIAITTGTTALNAAINAAQSFEVLEFRGASMAVDASVFAQYNSYTYTGAATGVVTVTEINGDTVGLSLNGRSGALTLTPATGITAGVLNIATTGTNAGGMASLDMTGLTSLALSSAGLATNLTGAITNNAGATITVTGSSTGLTIASLAAVGIVNASAFTGTFGVTGSAGNDSLTGSATGINTILGAGGNDVIVGGSLADTFTGGAGADNINGGSAADTFNIAVATDSLATGIVDGNSLTSTYLATLTNNTWDTYTTTVGDIVDTDVGAALVVSNAGTTPLISGAVAVANGMTYWNNGTNTYVMINSANAAGAEEYDATDTLIVLVGVHTVEAVGAAGAFQIVT